MSGASAVMLWCYGTVAVDCCGLVFWCCVLVLGEPNEVTACFDRYTGFNGLQVLRAGGCAGMCLCGCSQ